MAIIEYRFYQPAPSIEEILMHPEKREEYSVAVEYIPPIDRKNITPPGIVSSLYELSVTEQDGKIIGEVRKSATGDGSTAVVKYYEDVDKNKISVDAKKEIFFLDGTETSVPFVGIADYDLHSNPQMRSLILYRED